jgi:hypothetical protein
MSNHRKLIILIISSLLLGFFYGIIFQRYQVFPYSLVKNISKIVGIEKNKSWAISIYSGDSPFDLKPFNNMDNPVLTANNVTDIEALFVADPFIVFKDGQYYMFFEVFNKKDMQGDIAYATSTTATHLF